MPIYTLRDMDDLPVGIFHADNFFDAESFACWLIQEPEAQRLCRNGKSIRLSGLYSEHSDDESAEIFRKHASKAEAVAFPSNDLKSHKIIPFVFWEGVQLESGFHERD